jgi:type IV secretory pathway VirD2 relaxase
MMRALGERNDIIRRVRRGLVDQRIDRSVIAFAIDDGDAMRPIIGRLVARGLDDEI